MQKKIVLLMIILISTSCYAQQETDFKKFVEGIVEIESPICYKTNKLPKERNKPLYDINKKITKQDAIKYFDLTDNMLVFNNFDYNYDEDVKYDNWVEILPYINGKISMDGYISIIYSIDKFPNIGIDTSFMVLNTFTYQGRFIDKIEIRSQYTLEWDWKDVVFLTNNTFKIFQYLPNIENYNIKGGVYYIIDEERPQTIVEINDYQIDENGKIKLIKTHPKQYLKEFVSYYRSYHKDSDDPMNAY